MYPRMRPPPLQTRHGTLSGVVWLSVDLTSRGPQSPRPRHTGHVCVLLSSIIPLVAP